MNDEWPSAGVSCCTNQTWNLPVTEIIVTSTSVNLEWSDYSQVKRCEGNRKTANERFIRIRKLKIIVCLVSNNSFKNNFIPMIWSSDKHM